MLPSSSSSFCEYYSPCPPTACPWSSADISSHLSPCPRFCVQGPWLTLCGPALRAMAAPVCPALPTVLFLIPPEPHIIDSIFSSGFSFPPGLDKVRCCAESWPLIAVDSRIYMDLRAGLTWVQGSKPSPVLISCVAFKNALILFEPMIILKNGVLPMWIELEGIAQLLILLPLPWMG